MSYQNVSISGLFDEHQPVEYSLERENDVPFFLRLPSLIRVPACKTYTRVIRRMFKAGWEANERQQTHREAVTKRTAVTEGGEEDMKDKTGITADASLQAFSRASRCVNQRIKGVTTSEGPRSRQKQVV